MKTVSDPVQIDRSGVSYHVDSPPASGEKAFERHTHTLVVHKAGATHNFALDHAPDRAEVLACIAKIV